MLSNHLYNSNNWLCLSRVLENDNAEPSFYVMEGTFACLFFLPLEIERLFAQVQSHRAHDRSSVLSKVFTSFYLINGHWLCRWRRRCPRRDRSFSFADDILKKEDLYDLYVVCIDIALLALHSKFVLSEEEWMWVL